MMNKITITLDPAILEALKEAARADHRSVSKQIEYWVSSLNGTRNKSARNPKQPVPAESR